MYMETSTFWCSLQLLIKILQCKLKKKNRQIEKCKTMYWLKERKHITFENWQNCEKEKMKRKAYVWIFLDKE